MQNTLQNASYNFDNMLISVQNNISALSLDYDLIDGLSSKEDFFTYDYVATSDTLKGKLTYSKLNQDIIKSNYLISSDFQYFYRTEMSRTYNKDELLTTSWASQIEASTFYQWIPSAADDITDPNPAPMLSYVVPVKNHTMSSDIGYLIANIDYTSVDDFFSDLKFGETGSIVVYTPDMDIIYHPDYSLILGNCKMESDSPVTTKVTYTETQLITSLKSKYTGLIYTAYIPWEEIMKPAYNFRNLLFVILFACLILAVLFSVIISNTIFAPIQLLIEHMKLLGSGVRNPLIEKERPDEFGNLYANFNKMSSQIDTLINEVLLQQMLTKELQLKNLQNQLNPHFLYNTLDSIHWAAREKDEETVCNMIFLLSEYFRKNLNCGNEFLPIHEVNVMLQSYMELQSYRLADKFNYTIETDDSILSVTVPKQLFQPLVENALIHGIEKCPNKCFCHVVWKDCNEYILFSVTDNGVGISKEKLEEIKNSLSEKDEFPSEENFALTNIALQLKIHYHTTLQITSEYGKGTTVSFTIPSSKYISKED